MIAAALAVVASLCAVHDAWLSNRRMRDYGPEVELNPITRFLCAHVGQLNGVAMGVFVPHVLWTLVALGYDWLTAYAFYTGYVGHLFIIQRASLIYERENRRPR